MKLFHSVASPFVRKCMVVAFEVGLDGKIERMPQAAHPIHRNDHVLLSFNPLGQLPTFVTDDGQVLHDSRVICEYLDHVGAGGLLPDAGAARWACMTAHSLADGMMTAALLARYERLMRPADKFWSTWADAQMDKVDSTMTWLEKCVTDFGDRVDLATIAFACGVSYLHFRFPDLGWQARFPQVQSWHMRFSERRSMQATAFRELPTPLSASAPATPQR